MSPDPISTRSSSLSVEAPIFSTAIPIAMNPTEFSPAPKWSWPLPLVLFSGLVSLALLIHHFLRGVRFHRWLQTVSTPHERLQQLLLRCATRMEFTRTPEVRCLAVRCSPFLWAGSRPACIYIPHTMIHTFDDDQLEGVLCHELAHHARRDAWTSLFASVVTCLCWYNPLVWWARRQLRSVQELCCDAMVLERSGHTRRSYAESLLTTLDLMTDEVQLPIALASSWGDFASLKARFQMIADTSVVPRVSTGLAVVTSLLAVGLICIPVQSQSAPVPQVSAAESPVEVVPASSDVAQLPLNSVSAPYTWRAKRVENGLDEDTTQTEPVNGQVLLPNGQPAAGARVVLRRREVNSHFRENPENRQPGQFGAPSDLARTVTDAEGRFEFGAMPIHNPFARFESHPGFDIVDLDIVAALDGYAVKWAHVKPGPTVTMTLGPEVVLSGQVVTAAGQPVPAAKVQPAWIMSLRHITQADLEQGRGPSSTDRFYVNLLDCELAPHAVTNAAGEFQMRGLPAELGTRLLVDSEQFQPRWFDAATSVIEDQLFRLSKRSVQSGELSIPLTIPRYPLTVRVVDDITGEPLGGAQVSTSTDKHPDVITGGSFHFKRLPSTVEVSVYLSVDRGYLGDSLDVDLTKTSSVEIRLKRGIRVRGRVIDHQSGEPTAAYYLFVTSETWPQHPQGIGYASRISNGEFEALLPPGKHVLWTGGETYLGYRSKWIDIPYSGLSKNVSQLVHVDTEQLPEMIELRLDREKRIEGIVIDPEGKPVAEAHYEVNLPIGKIGYSGIGRSTLSDGTFQISEPFTEEGVVRELPLDLVFRHPQLGLAGSLLVDISNPSQGHKVQMERLGNLTGRVVDIDGKPLPYVTVSARVLGTGSNENHQFRLARPVITGADGRYVIPSGMTGRTISIICHRAGYAPSDLLQRTLDADERDKDLGEITLRVEGAIHHLPVTLPSLAGLSGADRLASLTTAYAALAQQVEETRKIARNRDVVPDNMQGLFALEVWKTGEANLGTDVELQALIWLLNSPQLSGQPDPELYALQQRAGTRILDAFANRPEIAALVPRVISSQWGLPNQPEEMHLAAVRLFESTPDHQARGIAALEVAESLLWGRQNGPSPVTAETAERVSPFLQRVIADYADQPHSEAWRPGTLGEAARGWLETLSQVQKGVPRSEILWEDSQGQPVRMSDLKGKVVLIDSGALELSQYAQFVIGSVGPQEVAFVRISPSNVQRVDGPAPYFVKPLEATQIQISGEAATRFSRVWNIRSWPSAIVIDRDGTVLGSDLRDDLPKVLATALHPKKGADRKATAAP